MNRSDPLSDLLADFVFRDRRIADQRSLRTSVFLAEGDVLRRVPKTGDSSDPTEDFVVPPKEGITGRVFSEPALAVTNDIPADSDRSDDHVYSTIACPIFGGNTPLGVLSLDSFAKLEFHERAHFLRRHLTISNPAAHILARVRLTITDNEPSGRLMVRPGPLSDPSPLPPHAC